MTKQRYKSFLIILLILFSFLCNAFPFIITTHAEERNYSNVLDDLLLDSSFEVKDFPDNPEDFGLYVFQIAESEFDELFLYVYQPSNATYDRVATSVNIAVGTGDEFHPKNYKLELLSSEGTLDKYIVKDFTIDKEKDVRTYEIPSIYSLFDEEVDQGLPDYNENIINEKAFEVGIRFYARNVGAFVIYNSVEVETIEILNPYHGLIRYGDGFFLWGISNCDSHFIAFSTSKPMDKLLEADVYFKTQDFSTSTTLFGGEHVTPGEVKEHYETLSYKEKVEHTGNGWFANTYTWDRIQTVQDLINSGLLNDEGIEDVQNLQWVLRFYESTYTHWESDSAFGGTYTKVSEVSILRLFFEHDGKLYNLGAVCDKVTGDGIPDGGNFGYDFWFIIAVLIIIISVVLIVVYSKFFKE